jgi:hypothetical protein
MADIALTQGERYTFAKVNTVPIIVGSTDGAEDDNFYRNDLYIEKSTLRIRNEGNTILQFTSSNEGNAGNRRWIMGIDSIDGTGVNSFAIHQGSSFTNTADFRVSGSTIVLDYDNMPDSDPGVKGVVFRSSTQLHVSAG